MINIGDKVKILGGVPIFVGLDGIIDSYADEKYNVLVGEFREEKGINYITRLNEREFKKIK